MVMTEMEALREKARAHDESADISAEMMRHRGGTMAVDDFAESVYHKGVAKGIEFAIAKLTGENTYPNLRASFWLNRLREHGFYVSTEEENAREKKEIA